MPSLLVRAARAMTTVAVSAALSFTVLPPLTAQAAAPAKPANAVKVSKPSASMKATQKEVKKILTYAIKKNASGKFELNYQKAIDVAKDSIVVKFSKGWVAFGGSIKNSPAALTYQKAIASECEGVNAFYVKAWGYVFDLDQCVAQHLRDNLAIGTIVMGGIAAVFGATGTLAPAAVVFAAFGSVTALASELLDQCLRAARGVRWYQTAAAYAWCKPQKPQP